MKGVTEQIPTYFVTSLLKIKIIYNITLFLRLTHMVNEFLENNIIIKSTSILNEATMQIAHDITNN